MRVQPVGGKVEIMPESLSLRVSLLEALLDYLRDCANNTSTTRRAPVPAGGQASGAGAQE
jgi:hypothetical protein